MESDNLLRITVKQTLRRSLGGSEVYLPVARNVQHFPSNVVLFRQSITWIALPNCDVAGRFGTA